MSASPPPAVGGSTTLPQDSLVTIAQYAAVQTDRWEKWRKEFADPCLKSCTEVVDEGKRRNASLLTWCAHRIQTEKNYAALLQVHIPARAKEAAGLNQDDDVAIVLNRLQYQQLQQVQAFTKTLQKLEAEGASQTKQQYEKHSDEFLATIKGEIKKATESVNVSTKAWHTFLNSAHGHRPSATSHTSLKIPKAAKDKDAVDVWLLETKYRQTVKDSSDVLQECGNALAAAVTGLVELEEWRTDSSVRALEGFLQAFHQHATVSSSQVSKLMGSAFEPESESPLDVLMQRKKLPDTTIAESVSASPFFVQFRGVSEGSDPPSSGLVVVEGPVEKPSGGLMSRRKSCHAVLTNQGWVHLLSESGSSDPIWSINLSINSLTSTKGDDQAVLMEFEEKAKGWLGMNADKKVSMKVSTPIEHDKWDKAISQIKDHLGIHTAAPSEAGALSPSAAAAADGGGYPSPPPPPPATDDPKSESPSASSPPRHAPPPPSESVDQTSSRNTSKQSMSQSAEEVVADKQADDFADASSESSAKGSEKS